MLNQAVNQDNTTISVVSSLDPSVYVQAVTILAVVIDDARERHTDQTSLSQAVQTNGQPFSVLSLRCPGRADLAAAYRHAFRQGGGRQR